MSQFINLPIVLLFFISIGCKKSNIESDINITNEFNPQLTEVITSSYSVKKDNGKSVKDTVNMIQSIIRDNKSVERANIFYNLDGSISWKDEYKFDDAANRIGSNFFEGGDKQTIYYKYNLDDNGKKIGFEAFDINTDTLLYDGASRFEDGGQVRKDGYITEDGNFIWNLEYNFDESGNELGYVYIDLGSGKRYESIYKYIAKNKNGDWIERHILENNEIQSIEIREFKSVDQL